MACPIEAFLGSWAESHRPYAEEFVWETARDSVE
jgi:hypothetical protein